MKYLLLILVLLSCTPQKRIERICRKHPEVCQRDTVKDTFTINRIKVDTFFSIEQLTDTVTFTKDSITYQLIYRDRKVFVKVDRPADTIIKEIPVERIIFKEVPTKLSEFLGWVKLFLIVLAVCVVAYFICLIIKLFSKFVNPKK